MRDFACKLDIFFLSLKLYESLLKSRANLPSTSLAAIDYLMTASDRVVFVSFREPENIKVPESQYGWP